jgi:GNAT superfamily N-acetyltransferase
VWSKCMRSVKLRMSIQEFRQLPRHPAYKYEYIEGEAWLTPRPKTYHALLELRPPPDDDGGVAARPVTDEDWADLGRLFAAAFRDRPPFLGLDHRKRRSAARAILDHARTGGDGPFVGQASFVAETAPFDGPAGGILITLLPDADFADWRSYAWREPPPDDAVARRLGRPHLTWVFVHPLAEGQGVGTALLHAATRRLLALGYAELASTFLLGNESSTLWHWRSGFRLAPSPWSLRRLKQ